MTNVANSNLATSLLPPIVYFVLQSVNQPELPSNAVLQRLAQVSTNKSLTGESAASACSASLLDGTRLPCYDFSFSKLFQIFLSISQPFSSGAVAGEQLAISNTRKHQILFANPIVRALSSIFG